MLIMLLMCYPLHRCDSEYQVHIMGCVLCVDWATSNRAIVMIHLCFFFKKEKKEKKMGHHSYDLYT